MSWFKLDDKLRGHKKWVALDVFARSLWVDAGLWCAEHNNDGVIPPHMIELIAFSAKVPPAKMQEAIALLLKVKLWKPVPAAKGGGWRFHDWEKYQPLREQVQRKAETQSNHDWLHKSRVGKAIKAMIRRRDGVWCRYCGIELNTDGDRRSPTRLTFDFVDPSMQVDRSQHPSAEAIDRAFSGIVLACGYCNAVKNMRTPEEAEMPLRPPPTASRDLPRSVRERIAGDPRTNRDPGSGRVGSEQVGPDLDVVGAGVPAGAGAAGRPATGGRQGSRGSA
jgi:hypothetical protein